MWRIRREDVLQRVRAGEQACPGCGWRLSVVMAGGMYHGEFARIACGPTDPCPYVDVPSRGDA